MKLSGKVRFILGKNANLLVLDDVTVSRHQGIIDTPLDEMLNDEMLEELTGEEDKRYDDCLNRPVQFTYEDGVVKDLSTPLTAEVWCVNIKKAILSMFTVNLKGLDPIEPESKTVDKNDITKDEEEDDYFRVWESSVEGLCETVYTIKKIPNDFYSWYETHRTPNILNVTKTFNLEHCKSRPFWSESTFTTLDCDDDDDDDDDDDEWDKKNDKIFRKPGCKNNDNDDDDDFDTEDILDSTSMVRYMIKGDRKGYVIERIEAESHHAFTPYSQSGGALETVVIQELELINQGPITTVPTLRGPHVKWTGLEYSYLFEAKNMVSNDDDRVEVDSSPENVEVESAYLTKDRYTKKLPKNLREEILFQLGKKTDLSYVVRMSENVIEYQDPSSWIPTLLIKLVKMTDEPMDLEAPSLALKLSKVLETVDFEELKEIWDVLDDDIKDPELLDDVQDIYLDILAMVANRPSILLLKELITNDNDDDITDLQAAFLLSTIAITATAPSDELIEEFREMCEHEQVEEGSYKLKQSCWLTYGSLLHTMCVDTKFDCDDDLVVCNDDRCSEEMEERFIKVLTDNIEPNDPEDERILFLKAIGNTGIDNCLEELSAVINDWNAPLNVRIEAVKATKRIAYEEEEDVYEVLMPMYMNLLEQPELRIHAFIVIMKSNPDLPIVQTIADSLSIERNLQVGSYVYNYLLDLSNSTYPCLEDLADDVALALKYADDVDAGLLHSKGVHYDTYSDDYEMGATWDWGLIWSNCSSIPQSASMRLNVLLFEQNINIMEAGIHVQGLQNLVNEVFGPGGHWSRKSTIFDFVKRHPRDTHYRSEQRFDESFTRELRELEQKLKFALRRTEVPRASIYGKLFDEEIWYEALTEETYKQLFEEGVVSISDIEQKLRTGIDIDFQKVLLLGQGLYSIPTSVGFPLWLSVDVPLALSVDGIIKAQVLPSLFASDRINKLPEKLILESTLIPSIAMEVSGKMAVFARHALSGVEVKARMKSTFPMSGKIEVNLKSSTPKLVIDFEAPSKTRELFYIESKPLTFVSVIPNHINKPIEFQTSVIPGLEVDLPEKFNVNFGEELWGMEFVWTGSYVSGANKAGAPYMPLTGMQVAHLYVDRTSKQNIKQFSIQITPDAELRSLSRLQERTPFNFDYYDTSMRSVDVSDYLRDLPIESRIFNVKVIGKGSSNDRVLQGIIRLKHSPDREYVQWDVEIERESRNSEAFRLCLHGIMKYPVKSWDFDEDEDEVSVTRKIEGALRAQWGRQCSSDKEIRWQLTSNKSEEKVRHERLMTQRSDLRSPIYKKCLKDRSSGLSYSLPCYDWYKMQTEVDEFDLKISHNKVPLGVLNTTIYAYEAFKMMNFYNLYINRLNIHNRPNAVEVNMRFKHNDTSICSLFIKTPIENVELNSVELPFPVPPLSTSYPWLDTHLNTYSKSQYEPFCHLVGNRVRTFDRVEYDVPRKDCPYVLARDCSSSQHFTLMGSHSRAFDKAKELKLFLAGHKIEIIPISHKQNLFDFNLKINGKTRSFGSEKKLIFRSEESDPTSRVLFEIENLKNHLKLLSREVGLDIEHNGIFTKVLPSPLLYRGQLCGLCGDYNGETELEYTGATGKLYRDASSFVRSYMLPEERCGSDTTDIVSSDSSDSNEDDCPEVMKNKHVFRKVDGVNQACFALTPTVQCTSGCKGIQSIERKLPFHCLPAHELSTKNLVRESKERVLLSLANKPVHAHFMVNSPQECIKK